MRYDISADPRLRARGDDLLPAPVIIRVGEIDDDGSLAFSKEMEKAHLTGQLVIPVVIDSYGGDAYALLSMVAQIKSSRIPVITIVEGKAMSAAAFLFSYGEHRFMAERAILMLHDVSTTSETGKTHEAVADATETARLHEDLFKEVARNCGKPDRHFLDGLDQRKHAEWYLTAKEAKVHGFISTIGLPNLSTSVTVVDALTGPDGHSLLTDARQHRNVTATPKKRNAR